MLNTDWAFEIKKSNTVYRRIELTEANLLPKRCTTHPATGNANNAPKGSIKRTAPNSASLSENISFTSGILEAQLEKMSPAKKKYRDMAVLGIVQKRE